MKKNKKAIAFGIEGFVALIIVLVVAVLLFLYVQRLNASTQSSCELERAICRSSAIQQSLALHVSNDLINT